MLDLAIGGAGAPQPPPHPPVETPSDITKALGTVAKGMAEGELTPDEATCTRTEGHALIALPTGAAAKQGGQVEGLAAQQCNQERAAIGKKAFHKKYGARHSQRSCAKKTRPEVVAAVGTANQDCQDELAQSGTVQFIDDYGVDPTDSVDSAMAECVAADVDQILNPQDYVDDTGDDGSA